VDIELLLSKHKADVIKPAMQGVAGILNLHMSTVVAEHLLVEED
jgi:hypothetical protein